MGNTHQVVDIAGQTTVTAPGQATQVYDGGVLAVRSNEGSYARDVFTMIPQLGAELGYQCELPLAGVRRLQRPVLGKRDAVRRPDRPERRSAQRSADAEPRNAVPGVPRPPVLLLGARRERGAEFRF